jgi:16S rRNA (cytosine967-C5)-methyltransferase
MLRDAWALAIETLSWIEMQKLSEHMAFMKTVKQLKINQPDSVRLAYGFVVETVRRKNLIDKFINSQLKEKTLDELNMGIQAFLRLYVYQTRISKNWRKMDFEEAKRIAQTGRSILGWETLREVEPILGFLLTQDIKPILEAAQDEERVALQTFHPTWFVKYCFDLFGREQALAFLEGNMHSPPSCIRLNTLKASQEQILEKLAAEEIVLSKVELLKHTYKVESSKLPLAKTNSFQQGLFYVQDKASCFAAEVSDPKPDTIVLDICAAPGAKTTYLAQLMQNQGKIGSIDYSKRRMKTWLQEVRRMGTTIAYPVIADAGSPLPFSVDANVVILDPPCTSTGVFAKLPAAKWRLTQGSIEKMAQLQWRMINTCAEKVAKGGFLTYSTCSITVEENEIIIERFITAHPEFKLVDINPKMGLPGLRGLEKCQRLYPHLHQCNGFFIAKLQKT